MKHILLILTPLLLCSCRAARIQKTQEIQQSTPPPEGFIPLAPPVVKEGSPLDYSNKNK